MVGSSSVSAPSRWDRLGRLLVLSAFVALVALAVAPAGPAFAGQAASGELLFYPCSSCHPVSEGGGAALPNRFEGHKVVLEGHDKLGTEKSACLVCHDDPAKDPGKLKLADGSLIDIKGDVAQVCYRCHSQKYEEFKAGAHGKNKPKCTSAGCHDPHAPGSMYADALLPFTGSGFQFKVLPEREAFLPLPPPAPDPAVETPLWFVAIATLGIVAVGGQAARLISRGRSHR
ncbi:MAG: hypothetical protein HY876_03370 [Coriobacteriales bacterium]|nr:hypothetical protein [Coriobacteriales bacterium]